MDLKSYVCEYCENSFSKKFNYQRHLLHIHGIEKISLDSKKDPTVHNQSNSNECEKCKKTFHSKYYLTEHLKGCKGCNKSLYQCDHCQKVFKNKKSIYQHRKICKHQPQPQRIYTRILYHPTELNLYTDHFHGDVCKKMLDQLSMFEVNYLFVIDYATEIFLRNENQCIQKKSLNIYHSQVHIGNNEWAIVQDNRLYTYIACLISNQLSEWVYANQSMIPKRLFKKVVSFLDCMSDQGYINTDDRIKEKEMVSEYKHLVRGLKIMMYNVTNNTVF